MHAVLLGGNSKNNQPWIRQVAGAFAPLFESCIVHEYAHWQSGAGSHFIDFNKELTLLAPKVQDLGEYIIFAKSVGTVLTAKGIQAGSLAPKGCIFTGVPLLLIKREAYPFTAILQAYRHPTLFVQNTSDPAGSFVEVKTYVEENNLLQPLNHMVELPGNTHDYTDLSALKNLTQIFTRNLS
jgi:predicted alpha/beta-hydrolase family hydrolase